MLTDRVVGRLFGSCARRSAEDEAFVSAAPEPTGLAGMHVVSGFVERLVAQAELRVQNARLVLRHRHRPEAIREAVTATTSTREANEMPDRLVEMTVHVPSLVYTRDADGEQQSAGAVIASVVLFSVHRPSVFLFFSGHCYLRCLRLRC